MRRREDWESLLKEQESSGQSISGFCRERGVSDSAFAYWRKKAGKEKASGEFVRVESNQRVSIELPGGSTIRILREDLGTLLEALCGR